MTTGTLIRPSRIEIARISNITTDCNNEELKSSEEQERNELLKREYGSEFVFTESNYYGDVDDLYSIDTESTSGRLRSGLVKVQETIRKQESNVWNSDKLMKLLDEPLGSPISLTREEAKEIIRLAAGRRPDLPTGKEFVREVREILGHSLRKELRRHRKIVWVNYMIHVYL